MGQGSDAPGLETRQMQASLERRMFGIDQPVEIGRFIVRERLGQGGMGTVFLAEDPGLERKVAIKVLRRADDDPRQRARLQKEAKTLARLAHPNVVIVYEVGEHVGDTYVAMEHVEGGDLASWLIEHPAGVAGRQRTKRSRQALELLVRAGRGLAAAHEAGIVHSDFKPGNVLVGADGRVRVADFGLARHGKPRETERTPAPGSSERDGTTAPEGGSVTAVGAGTPAYMAPEQHAGERVDAKSDQFSFAVAAWEILTGTRPFEVPASADAPPPVPARSLGVPAHVWRALRRGLSPDAADRYPSMEALLRDLERDPARGRRWASGGVLGLAGIAGAYGWASYERAHRCDDAGAPAGEAWSRQAQQTGAAAFEATGLAFAGDAWARVQTRLDDYTARWADAATSLCRVRVESSMSSTDAALVQGCLQQRLAEVETLVALLQTADRDLVMRGIQTVAVLPDLQTCSDPERIRVEIPPAPDPATATAVTQLRIELGRARIERAAGQMQAARDRLDAAQARADELGYGPAQAETLRARGLVLAATGPEDQAAEVLEAAYWSGLEHHHDAAAASAARALVDFEAGRGRIEKAEHWWQAAEVVSRRAELTDNAQTHLLEVHARLLGAKGDFRGAEALLREAIERWGEQRLPRAQTRRNLVVALARAGRFPEALEEQLVALDELEVELGEDHIDLAAPLGNLANLYIDLQRADEAEPHAERALALRRATFGDAHPSVASSYQTWGRVAYARGDLDRARERFERALDIAKAAKDPADPLVTRAASSLAAALLDQGEHARALEIHRGLLETYQEHRGPEHPDTGMGYRHVGWCLTELGRFDEALQALQQAETILTAALGNRHGAVFDVRRLHARALAGSGATSDARTLLQAQLELAADDPNLAPEVEGMREDLDRLQTSD